MYHVYHRFSTIIIIVIMTIDSAGRILTRGGWHQGDPWHSMVYF